MTNNRNILWRQGHILPEVAAKNLKLFHSESSDKTLVVIVSHDCDLANAQETSLEVVVGRSVEKPDGNFTHAKNARKVHIEFKFEGKCITIELLADKTKLLKQDLINYQPRKDFHLESRNHHTLQRWLAARYRRAAFPGEFNKRLKEKDLDNQLSKILRPLGSFISAIFFDVDEGEDIERTNSNDPYVLEIILLHTIDEAYENAYNAAMKAKQQIEKIFKEKLQTNGNIWQHIELKDCSVMSEEALSYRQSTMFKQWRFEHLSLKEDPVHPMID